MNEEKEVRVLEMNADKAAGMLSVAYIAERFFLNELRKECGAVSDALELYGKAIATLVFSALREAYPNIESPEWEAALSEATSLSLWMEQKHKEIMNTGKEVDA